MTSSQRLSHWFNDSGTQWQWSETKIGVTFDDVFHRLIDSEQIEAELANTRNFCASNEQTIWADIQTMKQLYRTSILEYNATHRPATI